MFLKKNRIKMSSKAELQDEEVIRIYEDLENILENHGFKISHLTKEERESFRQKMYKFIIEEIYGQKSQEYFRKTNNYRA